MPLLRSLLAVIRFELCRLRWLGAAALLCAAAGFLAPALPIARTLDPHDARAMVALSLAAAIAAVALIPTLATTWIRGLHAGRIAFHFARPIRSGTLWWGRLVAVTCGALGAIAVCLLPALPWAVGHLSSFDRSPGSEVTLRAGLLVLSLLYSAALLNAALVLFRRASVWSLLGLGALALTGILAWQYAQRDGEFASTSVLVILVLVLLLGLLVALLAGSYRQLAAGRTDPVRARRSFVAALAIGLALTLLAIVAGHWWALHPSPSTLNAKMRLFGAPRPSGWIVATGQTERRFEDLAAFFIHSTTGRWIRILAGAEYDYLNGSLLVVMDDAGRRAVVKDLSVRELGRPSLRYIDLESGVEQEVRVASPVASFDGLIALSDTERLVISDGGRPTVIDLPSGALVCAAEQSIPTVWRYIGAVFVDTAQASEASMLFDASDSAAECDRGDDEQTVHLRLDLSTCSVRTTVLCAPAEQSSRALALDPERLLALTATYAQGSDAVRELQLHDLAEGDQRTLLALGPSSTDWAADVHAAFLDDGSILATWVEGGRARVARVSIAGDVTGSWVFPPNRLKPIAQLASGDLLLANNDEVGHRWRVDRFDPTSGQLRPVVPELRVWPGWGRRAGRLPRSIIAEDRVAGTPVVIEHDGSMRPLPLRWLP
jgi:hypothetical protein